MLDRPKARQALDLLRKEREDQIDRWKRRIRSVGEYGLLLVALFAAAFGVAFGVTLGESALGWLYGVLQVVAHG